MVQMLPERIAEVASEALRAYGGLLEQPRPVMRHDRAAFLDDVKFIMANRDAGDEGLHQAWFEARLLDGWLFGEKLDRAAKRDPDLVPFDDLPEEKQTAERLLRAVVLALAPA
jgi:hypothetical protein